MLTFRNFPARWRHVSGIPGFDDAGASAAEIQAPSEIYPKALGLPDGFFDELIGPRKTKLVDI